MKHEVLSVPSAAALRKQFTKITTTESLNHIHAAHGNIEVAQEDEGVVPETAIGVARKRNVTEAGRGRDQKTAILANAGTVPQDIRNEIHLTTTTKAVMAGALTRLYSRQARQAHQFLWKVA